jgi:hypothetical protein
MEKKPAAVSKRREFLQAVGASAIVLSARIAGAAGPPEEAVVTELQPEGTQWVRITHPGFKATWRAQVPEDFITAEALYLVWHNISVEWKKYEAGEIGYDWEASESWIREAQQATDTRGLPIRGGVRIGVRLRPFPQGVDLSLKLTNLTGKFLKQVLSGGPCLQHQTERFIDNDASRTYIKTARGVTCLSEIDRTERIRCLYLFDSHWYNMKQVATWEWFWGRSRTRPASGFIASTAADGKGAVGIGFDQAYGVMQNSDAHHCMHSCTYFGDLKPGGETERRGVILFGASVADLFARFERKGYRTAAALSGPRV